MANRLRYVFDCPKGSLSTIFDSERLPMLGLLAIAFWLYLLSAGFIAAAWVMTLRLTPAERRGQIALWLRNWSFKGLAIPLLVWALMNFGLSWNLQPFMPAVQAARNSGGAWVSEWLRATATGFFIISSYWAAATLGWVLSSTSRGLAQEAQKDLRGLCFTCAAGLGIPAVIVLLLGGWPMLGLAAAIILAPMAGYAPDIVQPRKVPPMYARAIARIKFGKYREAEWEIIRELEKSEDDFEGWLMLAELYATRFSDLSEAERTVMELCDQPKVSPSEMAV